MKILREFYFADWRFFVVCGNKFLWFEMTEMSAGNYFLHFSVQVAELTSRWLIDFYQYMQKKTAIIENGWKKCGISDALANGVPSDDPFMPI